MRVGGGGTVCAAAAAALLAARGAGATAPPALGFSDMFRGGAVLQRGEPAAVWGTGAPGAVRLALSAEAGGGGAVSLSGAADGAGAWLFSLPAQPAGWNRTLTASDATGSVSVTVSFGETVLCVGQSNMGMQVGPSVRGFDADNATAEGAAAALYTGKISLHSRVSRWKAAKGQNANSTTWYPVDPVSIKNFSAVCWFTGRDLFDHLGGAVPVGLAMNAVGAHGIESWLTPEPLAACNITTPCTDKQPIAKIYESTVAPMRPYTFGSMIFDQAEQDINCDRQSSYACMEAQLVRFYREQFNATFPFVAVQLPGYQVPDKVFPMRLAQDAGAAAVPDAAVVVSYDLSCAEGKADGCPHGNVHNVHKQPVGARLARQLRRMKLREDVVSEGPRAAAARAAPAGSGGGAYSVTVRFEGGPTPIYFAGTRNCTSCCDSQSDFDVSVDGEEWHNGTAAVVAPSGDSVSFDVSVGAAPKWVRYTANRVYPQCAVYNAEGLPAYPFYRAVA